MLLDIFLADILILQYHLVYGLAEDFRQKILFLTSFRNVLVRLQQQEHYSSSGQEKQEMQSIILQAGAFASNGFGAFSPDGYSLASAFIAEFVLTLFFLLVILGATDKFANGRFAGIAIGLGLNLNSLNQYSNYKYFCKSCKIIISGHFYWWRTIISGLVILGCTNFRSNCSRIYLQNIITKSRRSINNFN